MKRVIEITGVAGVGKSFIINRLVKQNSNIILDKDIIKRYRLNDLKLFILFFKNKRALSNLINIVRVSSLLKMSLFDRVNFIRNSIKKIGKDYFLRYRFREDNIVLVDEGISHLYQNIISPEKEEYKDIIRILDKIIFALKPSYSIIVVDAPSKTIIKRLRDRGHKRITPDKIERFVLKSKEHISILKSRFPKTLTITNRES